MIRTISIDAIGLSPRARNALHRVQVHTVGDMLEQTEESLTQIRNLGNKSIREILSKMEEYRQMEASGCLPVQDPEALACQQPEMDVPLEQEQILSYLREKEVGIGELDLLPARAFNLLMFNGYEQLHQILYLSEDQLMEIPRMDQASAADIARQTGLYLVEHGESIRNAIREERKPALTALSLEEILNIPAYQASIAEYARNNDKDIENTTLPHRPKSRLILNGYEKISDILFLTERELLRLPSMGAGSVAKIQELIHNYLKEHEPRILAYCSGDKSVLWDDSAIEKALLTLYRDSPFAGFSLKEMTEKLEFPQEIPEECLKKIIGSLLARKELEYVDYRCYRVYDGFADFLNTCTVIQERSRQILQMRLQGNTLEAIGLEFGIGRERVRQIIKTDIPKVRNAYTSQTGKKWFDEDYYRYLYETYAFEKRDGFQWLGIGQSVWNYLDMLDVKPGSKELTEALEDQQGLGLGLRLKIKNYLNRNRLYIDGRWIGKTRAELEQVAVRKFCAETTSFQDFIRIYNTFLEREEVEYDEDLYYTESVLSTRKNHLKEAPYLLWKQNEQMRYYDIASRDFTELLDTLNLDSYENIAFSTVKLMRDYPEIMKKYDIQDQYELHNLLRKILPEGSLHDFHCNKMPEICFGTFDKESAILDLIIDNAPINTHDLCDLIYQEYGYDPAVVMGSYLQPFNIYQHQGVYIVDQKTMPKARREALRAVLTEDFYYIEEIRKLYTGLFPNADPEEVNPYNLKDMGLLVLSHYVLQNYPSLEAYYIDILTREDIVDIRPYRKRFTYVQMFYQTMRELKRNRDIIEFEPNLLLSFRRLKKGGVTKAMLQDFCDAVYDFVPDGVYFSIQSLKQDGFASDLFDLGFTDWFYANLLATDARFSFANMFGPIVLCKGEEPISIQSFLASKVQEHGCVDAYDLMNELMDRYGCSIPHRSDITYRLQNTGVYHDKILDRFYVSEEAYYRELEEMGGF